ncbi:MAG: glycosyltransferase family 87 protein [Chloroflexota bacterium]
MKRIALIFIIFGSLVTAASLLGDFIGLGRRGEIGAAQILGVDMGVGLFLLGAGLLTLDQAGSPVGSVSPYGWLRRVIDLPPLFWVVTSFVAVYLFLFVSPMFLATPSINYFTKYIPDAYVTHIGFDIDMTMGRVGRWLATGNSPYQDLYYYSPVTLIIFAPLLILGYPAYYNLSTFVTVMAFVGSSLILPLYFSRKRNFAFLLLLFVTGLFSYGFQFELERGQYNVITFALALFAIYLFHYHERLWFYAYLLFSLAIQLKIYPVFLTLMFIRDWRDWKNNLKRIAGLAFINFALLFVLGYQLFIDFVRNLTGAQLDFQSSRREDLSIKGFVLDLTTDIFPSLGQHTALLEGLFLALFFLCLVAVVIADYRGKRKGWNPHLLLISTIGMLIIPSASVDYKLPLLIAPLAILLSDLESAKTMGWKIISVILVFIASTAYWLTLYPFTVKPFIFSRNFPALFILLLSATALYFVTANSTNDREIADPEIRP